MNLTLERLYFREDGIFGRIPELGLFTLEHSFQGQPKIPEGVFECVRGMHTLPSGERLETFEVKVPEHSGLLFHPGNRNMDSAGCILIGTRIDKYGEWAVLYSRKAFEELMQAVNALNTFTLTVRNKLPQGEVAKSQESVSSKSQSPKQA